MWNPFKKKPETRSVNFESFGGSLFNSYYSDPLSIPALNQAVEVISSSVSSLPINSKNKSLNNILIRPNENQNTDEFINVIMRSLLIDGNAYIEKIYKNGRLIGLESHHYTMVSVEQVGIDLRYRFNDFFGRSRVALSGEVIHIKHNSNNGVFGTSKLKECAKSIEIASSSSDLLNLFFKNGSRPSGVLESDKPLSDNAKSALKFGWANNTTGDNSYKVPVLEDGVSFKEIKFSMVDAQFSEMFTEICVTEISRLFNIPPMMLNDLRFGTYTNATEQNRTFLTMCLRPWLRLIESSINHSLNSELTPVEFDTAPLLRMNQKERAECYKLSLNGEAWQTVNEVREAEGLEPIAMKVVNDESQNT